MQQAAVCFENQKYGDAAELMEYAAMICRILNREFLKICREISDGYSEYGRARKRRVGGSRSRPGGMWRVGFHSLPPVAPAAQHIIASKPASSTSSVAPQPPPPTLRPFTCPKNPRRAGAARFPYRFARARVGAAPHASTHYGNSGNGCASTTGHSNASASTSSRASQSDVMHHCQKCFFLM